MPTCLYYKYIPKLEKVNSHLDMNTRNCCVLHKKCMYKRLEVNLLAFIYKLCHEDLSSIIGTNTVKGTFKSQVQSNLNHAEGSLKRL